jgi:hypothetical protein
MPPPGWEFRKPVVRTRSDKTMFFRDQKPSPSGLGNDYFDSSSSEVSDSPMKNLVDIVFM